MILVEFDVLCKSDEQMEKDELRRKENKRLEEIGLKTDEGHNDDEGDLVWIPWLFNLDNMETMTISRNHRPHCCIRAKSQTEYIIKGSYEEVLKKIRQATELDVVLTECDVRVQDWPKI